MSSNETSPSPPRTWLAALVGLGFLASLWALFQWGELIAARAGATPFCSFGGNFDCAAVWDSAFARAVHSTTRVPVAGWGLMWGIVAFALSLVALMDERRLASGLSAALRFTALAGAASVAGLVTATVIGGSFCLGCVGTHVVVVGWAGLAWLTTRSTGFVEAPRGVMWSGGLVALSYALLFVPGTRTPHAMVDAGKDAMKQAVKVADAKPDQAQQQGAEATNLRFDGPATGEASRDEALQQFIQNLDPQTRQLVANLLAELETTTPKAELPVARAVVGDKNAPVRIIDFTDPLCGHCASLHAVLEEVRKLVPAGTFSVEPHFFPLDGTCNPTVERKWDTDIRCQAVRAQLCMEDDPEKLERVQKLIFDNQQSLTRDKLFSLLAGFADKKTLETCMASEATQKKLVADVDAGMALGLEGTPLLLMNGKEVKPFPPLVFALILTHGATRHPAFRLLPSPQAAPPGHDGHDHH